MQIISTPSTIWFELILRKGPDSPVLIPSANASQKYGPPEPKTQSEPPNTQTSEIGQEQELFCWIIENDRFMLMGTNHSGCPWSTLHYLNFTIPLSCIVIKTNLLICGGNRSSVNEIHRSYPIRSMCMQNSKSLPFCWSWFNHLGRNMTIPSKQHCASTPVRLVA